VIGPGNSGEVKATEPIFEQAGVALPDGDWTWDEFQQTAKSISTALQAQGIYGAAGGMDGQTTYYDTIFQAGGQVIDGNKVKGISPRLSVFRPTDRRSLRRDQFQLPGNVQHAVRWRARRTDAPR